VEDDTLSDFSLPKKYIQYSGTFTVECNLVIYAVGEYVITEYELDDGDERYLTNLNRNAKLLVTEDLFERLFDFLEKKSFETVC
jgi:hypothetical protein